MLLLLLTDELMNSSAVTSAYGHNVTIATSTCAQVKRAPTVTYLPYRVSGSTRTAVERSQLLARMDYCKTVLAGAPRTVTDKLQRVLNVAACVITGTQRSLIAVLVRYCTTNCIGSTSPTGFSSSWQ